MPVQQDIANFIDYRFTSHEILKQALQAAGTSMSDPSVGGDREGNKRLALVGDALLCLVILDEWYPKGTSTGKIDL